MTAAKRRLLAVDYGERRTGLAGTDGTGTLALPLPAIHHHDLVVCATAVAKLASERDAECIVVGLPLGEDGVAGKRAQRTQAFVDTLRRLTSIEVATWDESFTTDLAHERLREGGLRAAARKKLADSVAALVLLERYREGTR